MIGISDALRSRLALGVVTLGGIGYFPRAPGTVGTLAMVPICFLMQQSGQPLYGWILFLLVTGVGFWAVHVVLLDRSGSGSNSNPDAPEIVIDEASGYLLTVGLAPRGWLWLVAGFLLFRLFDIWKPGPVGWVDRHMHNAAGIMMDDIVAGLLAGVCLFLMALP